MPTTPNLKDLKEATIDTLLIRAGARKLSTPGVHPHAAILLERNEPLLKNLAIAFGRTTPRAMQGGLPEAATFGAGLSTSDFKNAMATIAKIMAVRVLSATADRDSGAPHLIAQAYKAVQRAELACRGVEENLERARQAYWNERAKQVEQQLLQAVEPHLGAIEFLRRASGAFVPNPAMEVLGRALHQPRAPFAVAEGEPPIVPMDSPVLERAEDSNVFLLRGAAAL